MLIIECVASHKVCTSFFPSMKVGHDLQVFDGMMLQQIFLKPESPRPSSSSNSDSTGSASVLLLLHVGDDVKAGPSALTKTCFGVPWQKFFQVKFCSSSSLLSYFYRSFSSFEFVWLSSTR